MNSAKKWKRYLVFVQQRSKSIRQSAVCAINISNYQPKNEVKNQTVEIKFQSNLDTRIEDGTWSVWTRNEQQNQIDQNQTKQKKKRAGSNNFSQTQIKTKTIS